MEVVYFCKCSVKVKKANDLCVLMGDQWYSFKIPKLIVRSISKFVGFLFFKCYS